MELGVTVMSRRKQREQQFLSGGGTGVWVSASSDLATCALSLLRLSLEDRVRPVFRTVDNHSSAHAVGSIGLVVAALEAWLNEAIMTLSTMEPEIRGLATQPVDKKYYAVPLKVAQRSPSHRDDLAWLLELRHEITHYLPRPIPEEGNVPSWLVQLHRRNLFITSGHPRVDFVLGQKLGSYRLAYWAWETVESVVTDFLGALGELADFASGTAANFSHYKTVCRPTALSEFDLHYGLTLTAGGDQTTTITNKDKPS